MDRVDRLGDLSSLGIGVGEVVEGCGGGRDGGGGCEVVERLGLVVGSFMRVYIFSCLARSLNSLDYAQERGHTFSHEHANDPLDFLYFDLQRLLLCIWQLGYLNDVSGQTGIKPRFAWLIHPCQQLGACQQGRHEFGIVVCFVRCGRCLFHERFGLGGRLLG